MLITNHVLAGRIIGRALAHRPAIAFGAGVVSHLVMDALPHWGTVAGAPGSEEQFMRVARRDGTTGLAAIALCLVATPPEARQAVLAAMMGAAFLDLDKPCLHFFGFDPFPMWCRRLHKWVQREATHRLPYEVSIAAGLAASMLVPLPRTAKLPIPAQ